MGAMRMTTATRLTERNWTLARSVGRSDKGVSVGAVRCLPSSAVNQSRSIDATDATTPTDVSIPSNIGFGRSWFLFLLLCIHEGGFPVVPDQKRRRVDRSLGGEVCLIALDRLRD